MALSLALKAEVDAIVHQDDGASVRKQQDRGVFVSAAWGTSYPKRSGRLKMRCCLVNNEAITSGLFGSIHRFVCCLQ
jgi:hypothetical protein